MHSNHNLFFKEEFILYNDLKYIYPEMKTNELIRNENYLNDYDLFVIEICSLKVLKNETTCFNIDTKKDSMDENIVDDIHFDYDISSVMNNNETLYSYKQTFEEIKTDIENIAQILNKPIILVPNLNIRIAKYPHCHLDERILLETYLYSISLEHENIYFFDPKSLVIHKPISLNLKYEVKDKRQGISHYNENGHKLITKNLNKLIYKVLDNKKIYKMDSLTKLNNVFLIGTDFIKKLKYNYSNDNNKFETCYRYCWSIKQVEQYIEWCKDDTLIPEEKIIDQIYDNFNIDDFRKYNNFNESEFIIINLTDLNINKTHDSKNDRNVYLDNNYCWDKLDWSLFDNSEETEVQFKNNISGNSYLLSYDDFKNSFFNIINNNKDKKFIFMSFTSKKNQLNTYLKKLSNEISELNNINTVIYNLDMLKKEDYSSLIILNDIGIKKLYESIFNINTFKYLI